MTATILLTLSLLAIVKADTKVDESKKDTVESLIERQSVLINALLGEMKTRQLQDHKDIVRNEKEIVNLKRETEILKAIISGRINGPNLQDIDAYSTSFQNNKRAFTQSPPPTQSLGKVAFSAKLSSDHNGISRETIRFNNIITNNGGHYSSSTGNFIVPTDGTYFFSATTSPCSNGSNFQTYLVRNAIILGTMYAADRQDTGSIGITLKLIQGDKVYVVISKFEDFCIREDSFFSGFQI